MPGVPHGQRALGSTIALWRGDGQRWARDLLPEAADVFPGLAADHGGQIPATEFLVYDVEPYDVLQAITNRFELKMRARARFSTCRPRPICYTHGYVR